MHTNRRLQSKRILSLNFPSSNTMLVSNTKNKRLVITTLLKSKSIL